SVVDHRLDLAPMPHDARVAEEPLHVPLRVAGDALEIEVVKGAAEVLALGEDRPPAQPGLEPFEAELLEEPSIVHHGKSPFGVVVVEELGGGCAPAAARLPIGSEEGI